jgi:CheY-like chemotaxis protein
VLGALIVVVEDDLKSANMLKRLLPRYGYRVMCCGSGEAAVKACQDEPPAVVIMDIELPGMNGIETMLQMRQMPSMRATRFIAVTASIMTHRLAVVRDTGFDRAFSKPIDVLGLASCVGEILKEPVGLHERRPGSSGEVP